MATHYLIKKKAHSFLTQLLNIFYLLNDTKSLLFSKFLLQSFNSSFLNVLLYLYSLPYLLKFYYLFTGTLGIGCMVTVTFKFIVMC